MNYGAWCQQLFNSLAEGGIWGVPRSGLIFQRQRDAFVLIGRMPHAPGMPLTEAELHAQQEADYVTICEQFGRVGITVRKNDLVS